jgi:hypothetical protein
LREAATRLGVRLSFIRTERAPFGGPVAMRIGVGGCWSRLGGTRLG